MVNGNYVYLVEYDADWDAPYGDMDDIVARTIPTRDGEGVKKC